MRLNTIIGILLLSCVYCISCSSASNEERVPCSFVCNTNDILYSGGNTPYRLSHSPLDCIPGFQSFHSDTITSENIGKNYTAVWSLIYDSLQLCMLEHTDSIKYGENRECPAALYTDLQKFLNRSFVTDERIQFLSPEIRSSKVMTATWVTGVFYIQELSSFNNTWAPFYELTCREGRIISMRRLYPCQ